MLIDSIVSAISGVLTAVFSSMPEINLSDLLQNVTGPATSLGERMAPWNAWLPLKEYGLVLGFVVGIWLPGLAIYVLCNWIWRHIPEIMGVGPGAG